MATASVTLKLNPDEYRTLRMELDFHRSALRQAYSDAKDNGWHNNPDGRALAARQLRVEQLLSNI